MNDGISQSIDGKYWMPAVPQPLWVGFHLRTARCDCGREFRGEGWRGHGAIEEYRTHYQTTHQRWADRGGNDG